jgi:hypothetical protein
MVFILFRYKCLSSCLICHHVVESFNLLANMGVEVLTGCPRGLVFHFRWKIYWSNLSLQIPLYVDWISNEYLIRLGQNIIFLSVWRTYLTLTFCFQSVLFLIGNSRKTFTQICSKHFAETFEITRWKNVSICRCEFLINFSCTYKPKTNCKFREKKDWVRIKDEHYSFSNLFWSNNTFSYFSFCSG